MYCRVISATGMSRMSRFCRRIRYSSRSSGPSKDSRMTSSASGGMYRSCGICSIGSPRTMASGISCCCGTAANASGVAAPGADCSTTDSVLIKACLESRIPRLAVDSACSWLFVGRRDMLLAPGMCPRSNASLGGVPVSRFRATSKPRRGRRRRFARHDEFTHRGSVRRVVSDQGAAAAGRRPRQQSKPTGEQLRRRWLFAGQSGYFGEQPWSAEEPAASRFHGSTRGHRVMASRIQVQSVAGERKTRAGFMYAPATGRIGSPAATAGMPLAPRDPM